MEILDYLHLLSAILFAWAGINKLHSHQAEHFYSRIIASLWFMMTVVFREYLPVQWVRDLSNYVVMTIPIVEILSQKFMQYWKSK